MTRLTPSDIVGNRIARVLQTPWRQMDDVSVCQVYVAMDTGIVFELAAPEEGYSRVLDAALAKVARLIDVDFGGSVTCNGDVVLEVLQSDYWPTIGLLLSSNRFLHCGSPSPGLFCACVSAVGEIYDRGDVERY